MADTIIADRARAAKASRLLETLHAAGATSDLLPYLTDDDWQLAARRAGVRVPSQATRDLVRHWLVEREASATADAFAGLDDAFAA